MSSDRDQPPPPPSAPAAADEADAPPGLPRRAFVSTMARAAAFGAVAGWTPILRSCPPGAPPACSPPPPGFPTGISIYAQPYKNWSGEISIPALWTCAPKDADEVVAVCNWAAAHAYKVRPRGKVHNWSPLAVAATQTCNDRVVLLDTTQHLTAVSIDAGSSPQTVTAQTGVTMESLLAQLEQAGLGLTAHPAPGDLTLGGVLAIDGHGTAVPADGEAPLAGHTYGSVSNLILSLTAVVWDAAAGRYALKTFRRDDPRIQPLLAHVGRALVTSVTLQVGANQRLRCQSWYDVPASELFAPQGSSGRTMASYIASSGRVEAIWFPFTEKPWLKVWTVAPDKPLFSIEVDAPYNYPFSDKLSQPVLDLINAILGGNPGAVKQLGPVQYGIVAAGLTVELKYDLWGWAKNLNLYVRPTTERVTANGYAVLCARADVQRVINDFYVMHNAMVAAYQASGLYPMNGPVEIRVTGLDQPSEVQMGGALSPQLSALRPRPDQPSWDTAVWFDILTLPGTPASARFYRDVERWMVAHYSGSYAAVRVEWSKGWGYSTSAAWDDPTALGTTVPESYRAGQRAGDDWDAALSVLDSLDPRRLFSSPLLDRLMP